MKVALAAQGRFHAFDYARELALAGHDVALLTPYPRWYATRWGVPPHALRSFIAHGAVSRLLARHPGLHERLDGERRLHEWFGRLTARALEREAWDAVVCWSSIGLETFRNPRVSGLRVCHRSSAHISVQDAILRAETARTGAPAETPSAWMIRREEQEYAEADRILVPSTFALDTFLQRGVARERMLMVPLGVDTAVFAPSPSAVEARVHRMLDGRPLRVACVGTVSLQKGLWDVIAIAEALRGSNIQFTWTGAVAADAAPLLDRLARVVTLKPPVAQRALPDTWADADVFLFPTLQDGFGMVVSQALASGVPVLGSANSCAPDVLVEGQTGWVLPARAADAFIARLQWCDDHRDALATACGTLSRQFRPRTWADSAALLADVLRHERSH